MRRVVLIALVTAIATVTAPGSATATNRQYTVLKCHVFAPTSSEVQVSAGGAYESVDACGTPDQRFELTVNGFGLPGQAATIGIGAPENTAIVGVIVDANLRRDNHHLAQLDVLNPNGTWTVLANGDDTGSGFQSYTFSGLNGTYFAAQLVCGDPGGCPNSALAHAYVKNIALVLEDRADPGITSTAGSLLGEGWKRGLAGLTAEAGDLGSGVAGITASVNGAEIGEVSGTCTGFLAPAVASVLLPCSSFAGLDLPKLNTAASPFVNGPNPVSVCTIDFAGNGPSCEVASVMVDNQPPALAFANSQDPLDPELIRVSAADPHSGVDAATAQISYRPVGGSDWTSLPTHVDEGALTARVDSDAAAAGRYEFTASVNDVAGNPASTVTRADGEPMILSFPLREPVQLISRLDRGSESLATIGYGRDSQAQGQLLNGDGQPMAGRTVVVTEYFGEGALIDRRVRAVTTDKHGRWRSLLPAGPSRTVIAEFAGTAQYQPMRAQPAELRVRSRTSFELSRQRVHEGGSVLFEGKVGHFGARVPAGGKLIELQVREGRGRWNTVREAFHTDSSGRFHLRYRFGRFYETNARFIFRVKIAREQGWPYMAPSRSQSRAVTVVANR
jgi:hypothetical protein